MLLIVRSSAFDAWVTGLQDNKGKARILARLTRAAHGNFGDCAPVGDGVSEMRIHYGPGYRVYFVRNDLMVYVLLNGGDKGSQQRDIETAKKLARELRKSER